MPRRRYKKIKTPQDLIYKSYEVTKLINYLMHDGKKSTAQNIIYSSLKMIKDQNLDPILVLGKAIANVAPAFEVRPRRVGGASYLVPTETSNSRRLFLALNWIIEAANSRSSKEYKTFDKKMFTELMEASRGEGRAVEKRKQVEKLAEANKAFAHFRW